MKRLLWLMGIIVPFVIFAQAQKGIRFEQGLSFEQVQQKARMENRYVFIDCYASWCGPCKKMDDEVYIRQDVKNFANDHFISLKLQMDTSAKDDDLTKSRYVDAHKIMKQYSVTSYPTFLFFSPEGKLVHKGLGFLWENQFIDLLKDAVDPNEQYYTQLTAFKQNWDYSKVPKLVEHARSIEKICRLRWH